MVPIFFDFVSRKITGWSSWVDKELSNGEFVNCLECVGILKSIAISKNLEGFRDAKGLRHLVHRWCPSFYTFFFFVGELTITLEDVVNNFLLPVFGARIPLISAFLVRISRLKTSISVTSTGVLPLLGEISQNG